MGTGSYSSGVTWSATYGTISTAGVYTAPLTVPASGMDTITATSTQDATKSGTAAITVTAAPTITSVTVSCNPTSLQAHQTLVTSQCTATVQGTGSYSSAVTWSATYGAITTAGVYTAPLTVPASGMDTITAISTQDATKSGTATIAVTAARVITLTAPYPVVSQAEAFGGPFPVQINAQGIQAGDVISITEMGTTGTQTIASADASNGYFTVNPGINGVPSFVQVTCGSPTNANTACNTAWIAITTDQQEMVESKDGTLAYFNPGFTFHVQEYSIPAGIFQANAPLLGANIIQNTAITVDGGSIGTGDLLSDVDFRAIASTTGTIADSGNNTVTSIVARDGFGYFTYLNGGNLQQFDVSTLTATSSSPVAAGSGPYAIDAETVNGADAIVVFSGGETTMRLFNNSLTLEGNALTLSNITGLVAVHKANLAQGTAIGGWPLRILGSGSAAGTVGLLSSYDNLLTFLTINSSNQLTLPAGGQVTVAGNPYLIAPDATHGAFIVASADTTTGTTTLQSISATSPYTATSITPSPALPAGFLASGMLVSDDGSKLYLAGIYATATPTPAATPAFYIIALMK
jgi:hypothetical protein